MMRTKKILALTLAAAMICSSAAVSPTAALADATGNETAAGIAAETGSLAEASSDNTEVTTDNGSASGDNSAAAENGNASGDNSAAAENGNTDGENSASADTDSTVDKDSDVSDSSNTDAGSAGGGTVGGNTAAADDGNATDGDTVNVSDTGNGSDAADPAAAGEDQEEASQSTQSSVMVTPEQYQIILAEDGSFTACYTVITDGEESSTVVLKDCWLLADPEAAEDGTSAEAESAESADTESLTASSWQILDPATASEYPDAVLFSFDEEGVGTTDTGSYSGAADIFYEGSTTAYYVESGKIRTGSISWVTLDDALREICYDGRIIPYTGCYEGSLYDAGSRMTISSQYVFVNCVTEKGTTIYEYVDPDSYSNYPDAVIYYVDSNGKATLYTDSGIITLTYGSKTCTYYVTKGKLQALAKSMTYWQNSTMYYVAADGQAKIYSGVYKSHFYVKGKIKTASATYYGYFKNYIYKVDKTGKAVKYTKSGTSNYYMVVYQTNGKKYLCYANPKTAAARIVIADKNKTTCYQKAVGAYLYNVVYNTGAVSAFTGVYKGKYYSAGKCFSAKISVYRVYNGYAYSVSKTGAASVYIKNKSKSGVYCLYAGGQYYMVYYKNGKVKAQATDAQIAAVSTVALKNTPNSTTFTKSTSAARAKLVNTALSFLGTTENTPRHQEILELYNLHTPLARNLVMGPTYAWCACFVSAMFIKSGNESVAAVECSCAKQVEMWKKKGCWIENDAYVPKTGDIIYYHWNCKTKGDCTTWPNHVGIVVSVSNGMITVVEGNTTGYTSGGKYIGQVDYRNIKVNAQTIRGFASPKY